MCPKVAACIWHELVTDNLNHAGLMQLESAWSISKTDKAIALCYAQDLLIFAKRLNYREYLTRQLQKRLSAKVLGEPQQLLGMEVTWGADQVGM